MTYLKVLDVTLRDGGYVNNFTFGVKQIEAIITYLIKSKVDAIELGFLKNCEFIEGRTCYNLVTQAQSILDRLGGGNPDQQYFLMIRPDWYDISRLEPCSHGIETLRFAFHSRDSNLLERQVNVAKEKGYKVFLNPVNITGYSKSELISLLLLINSLEPYAVAIVDTFGSLMQDDLQEIYNLFNDHLNQSISLCFHPHDNLLLSFSLSQEFISLTSGKRNTWIDSSINGMGRAPGNLQTEIILSYLNKHYNTQYELESIFSGITEVIANYKKDFSWGYHPLYAISAFHKIHRSYPEYLLNTTNIPMESMYRILLTLANSKNKNIFDEPYISKVLCRLDHEK